MELYFSPLSCALATRITLHEVGATAAFVQVDARSKRTEQGEDFFRINPLGLVPTLRLEDGTLLTEGAAILQYLGRRFPEAGLVPEDDSGLIRLQQWLNFIATELHKLVFQALLSVTAPEGAKQYALSLAPLRLGLLERHLTDRDYLLERFSVADAYLVTVLGWAVATPIKLDGYPALQRYLSKQRERPSVRRALSEERPLYMAEQQASATRETKADAREAASQP